MKLSKRLLAALTALLLLLSITACAPAQPEETEGSKPSISVVEPTGTAPTQPEQTEPLPTEPEDAQPPVEDCTHSDSNGDHTCDSCGGWLLITVDLFALNDLHGKFTDSELQPGVDELSSYLQQNVDENDVLFASGDIWQGSSESNLTYGAIMTDWMNEMDFAAMTLGNHEFDWGTSYIEANAQLAEFPLLAINIYDRNTNTQVPYCRSSVVLERGGIQIGIIGAIGDCYSSISSDKTGDIYFKTGTALTGLVKAEANRLRQEGVDIIIYSLHDGYDRDLSTTGKLTASQTAGFYDASLSQGYVDIVFGGHTHKSYVFTDTFGVYHLQGGGENTGLSHAVLVYDMMTGKVSTVTAEIVDSDVYDDSPAHPVVDTLLQKYDSQLAAGREVLGTNSKERNSTFLRQLMAELYYKAGLEKWGSQYDIVLGGGYLSIRNPYTLYAGEVTYGDLYALFPFDNDLVLCSVKGSSLRDNFFETDNKNYYLYYESYGQQVKKNLDPNATYYIIVDSYSSSYGPSQLTEVARISGGIYGRDLMAAYIREEGLSLGSVPGDRVLTDIPTLKAIGGSLPAGQISQEGYFVTGKIVSVANVTYGNFTITDDKGNTLYIYGSYSADGSQRYGQMSAPPKVGDTVTLYGKLQHYVPGAGAAIIEMVDARILD